MTPCEGRGKADQSHRPSVRARPLSRSAARSDHHHRPTDRATARAKWANNRFSGQCQKVLAEEQQWKPKAAAHMWDKKREISKERVRVENGSFQVTPLEYTFFEQLLSGITTLVWHIYDAFVIIISHSLNWHSHRL